MRAISYLAVFYTALAIIGFVVGGEFGVKWGWAAVSAVWLLAPQVRV